MEDTGFDPKDLEQIANTYDQIRALFKKKHPEADSVLAQAFEKAISQALGELSSKKSSAEDFRGEVLQARFKLWNMCGEKLCAYIKTLDSGASKILVEIFSQIQKIIKESHGSTENLSYLQEELERSKTEVNQILAAAEELESTVRSLREENARLRERSRELPEDLESQLQQLQEENEKYLQKIISLSKEKADSVLSKDPGQYAAPRTAKEKPRETKKTSSRPSQVSNIKELTLKQLKEFIEDIYSSKEKYDSKCSSQHLPKETMEQYMDSYLNKKYGLKSLKNDWYNATIKAVDKYEAEDPDILLFAKILRHQIEESYRTIIQDVKNKSLLLLKIHLKNKFPYMQEKAISDLLSTKTQGDLEEEEWKNIVNYMYTPSDSQYLISLLNEHAERSQSRASKAQGKATLSYSAFVNLLLEFQVTGHDQLLEAFREKFAIIDPDSSGVLTAKQFSELLAMLDILEENERLVKFVDPADTGKITFSDIVSALLSHQLEHNGNFVSIIYKLHLDKH